MIDERKEKIEKRLNNLVWTASGDYGLEAETDVASFEKSPWIALYDAVRQGAFARFFDRGEMAQYLRQKVLRGAEPTVLFPIARMCMDSAVWEKAGRERIGVPELRRRAFQETLEKDSMRLTHTNWGALEACYLRFCLYGESRGPSEAGGWPEEWAKPFVDLICSIRDAENTAQVISCAERVYEEAYEKGFADWFKGLSQLMKADGRPDDNLADQGEGEDEEERAADLFTEQMEQEDDSKNQKGEPSLVVLEDQAMARMRDYVEQNYGRSYLSLPEQQRLEQRVCSGAHSGRHLHFTDGILREHGAGPKCEFDRKIKEENQNAYREKELVTRQNIQRLADVLIRGMFTRQERELFASEYGTVCVNKLWNLGRTHNRKLFYRKFIRETEDFVVEVLIDASGSQQVRQSKVALQAYIISEALSMAGIPCRVMGFCTFGEYTVLRRFRDYDEKREANERIFEFYGSANNRDGLAIRAAAESLSGRGEENKILIVLSDGTPNDIIVSRSKFVKGKNGKIKPAKPVRIAGTGKDGSKEASSGGTAAGVRHRGPRLGDPQEPYCAEYAVRDTAAEVYGARNRGILVLGIFAGLEEALPDERKIFGNDFVYIRDIADFSNVVGRYLKEQILDR